MNDTGIIYESLDIVLEMARMYSSGFNNLRVECYSATTILRVYLFAALMRLRGILNNKPGQLPSQDPGIPYASLQFSYVYHGPYALPDHCGCINCIDNTAPRRPRIRDTARLVAPREMGGSHSNCR